MADALPENRSLKPNKRSSTAAGVWLILAYSFIGSLEGASLDTYKLHRAFVKAAGELEDGRVGVCAKDAVVAVCLAGQERFSLQSVMKLVVAITVLDAVDSNSWQLDTPVIIHKQDLSLNVQPIADLVLTQGEFRTTVGDLVRRAIVDSDSAATDILINKLGGLPVIQSFLVRKQITDLRIDRDERHLQTETGGLNWKPEYTDKAVLERARAAVPEAEREKAFDAYQHDVRDTSTPLAMATLLQRLAAGQLLSSDCTRYLLDVMGQTVTFPDRLKAGVSKGWTIAHKTGTSGTWRGITVATNDVGILTAPDGRQIAIAVFIKNSRASSAKRASVMAKMAAAVIDAY